MPTETRTPRVRTVNPYRKANFCERVNQQVSAVICMVRRNPTALFRGNGKRAMSAEQYKEYWSGTCRRCQIWPEVNQLVVIQTGEEEVEHEGEEVEG